MNEITVPIYLMTGFLESGKTSFLSFTIQQDYFHTDGKTLLILCEEGEEEYDPAILKANNTVVEVIENEEDFTTDRLVAMDILHQPERVIIEYNGMWLVSNFEKMQLPKGWGVEQQITCVDGSTFQMYMANMKSIFMDMIKNTDMVIFNRCKKEDPLPTYRRGIKVANQRAEVILRMKKVSLAIFSRMRCHLIWTHRLSRSCLKIMVSGLSMRWIIRKITMAKPSNSKQES